MHQGEKLAALGMVIGGIAHEIRNPLGVSSAAAQLMMNRMTSPLFSKNASERSWGYRRASLVVESLLRFARPGPIKDTTSVNVIDVLNNALMFASGEARPGQWLIRIRHPRPSPSMPKGCKPSRTGRYQSHPERSSGDAKRRPADHRTRRDEEEVVIEIGDTGPGIPESHLSKIFDPFFTMRSDSRRSGLGLSVSAFHRAPARRQRERPHVTQRHDVRRAHSNSAGTCRGRRNHGGFLDLAAFAMPPLPERRSWSSMTTWTCVGFSRSLSGLGCAVTTVDSA